MMRGQPSVTLASSSEPRKYSEPGRAPIAISTLLAIEPTLAAFENACPSTITWIDEDVFRHWTVCQRPSLIDGPAISSL